MSKIPTIAVLTPFYFSILEPWGTLIIDLKKEAF